MNSNNNHSFAVAILLAMLMAIPVARADTKNAGSIFVPRAVEPTDLKPVAELRNVGSSTPEACFETWVWARATGNVDVISNLMYLDAEARHEAQLGFDGLTREQQAGYQNSERMIAVVLSRGNPPARVKFLEAVPNAAQPDELTIHWLNIYANGRTSENRNIFLRRMPDGWRSRVPTGLIKTVVQNGLQGSAVRRAPPVSIEPLPKINHPVAPGMVELAQLQDRGNATPLAALETIFWAQGREDFATLERLVVVRLGDKVKADDKLAQLSAEIRVQRPEVNSALRYAIAEWIARTPNHAIRVDTETAMGPERRYYSGHRQDARTGAVSNFDIILRRSDAGWKYFMADMDVFAMPAPKNATTKGK